MQPSLSSLSLTMRVITQVSLIIEERLVPMESVSLCLYSDADNVGHNKDPF